MKMVESWKVLNNERGLVREAEGDTQLALTCFMDRTAVSSRQLLRHN
jgi:hypothetical protein